MELVIGTHNQGKLREYRKLLAEAPLDIVGLDDIGLHKLDVDETGDTFEANAALKAHTYARASGRFALADDSGLEVDALDGAPGVYSARYGGNGLDDAGRRQKLLVDMVEVPDKVRTARFVCVIAVADPRSSDVLIVRGTVEGKILREDRDKGHGFGYDPVFMPDGYDQTFGELDPEVKNSISHRGAAAKLLLPELKKLL